MCLTPLASQLWTSLSMSFTLVRSLALSLLDRRPSVRLSVLAHRVTPFLHQVVPRFLPSPTRESPKSGSPVPPPIPLFQLIRSNFRSGDQERGSLSLSAAGKWKHGRSHEVPEFVLDPWPLPTLSGRDTLCYESALRPLQVHLGLAFVQEKSEREKIEKPNPFLLSVPTLREVVFIPADFSLSFPSPFWPLKSLFWPFLHLAVLSFSSLASSSRKRDDEKEEKNVYRTSSERFTNIPSRDFFQIGSHPYGYSAALTNRSRTRS